MRCSVFRVPMLAAAACQPDTVVINYDVDAPLYGSEDDPGGAVGAGSGGGGSGGGGGPVDAVSGSFRMAHVSDGGFTGSVSCEAWWNVVGEPASTDCPDCGFTLDWAFDMTYALDASAVSLPSGCEWTNPGFFAGSGSYGDQMLSTWLGTWAFSPDYADGGSLLMGYAYYGYSYWQPLRGATVSSAVTSLEWHYVEASTYGGYGYYDEYSVSQYWDGYAEVD